MVKKIGLFILVLHLVSCTETPLKLSHKDEIILSEEHYSHQKEKRQSTFIIESFIEKRLQKEAERILKKELIENEAAYGCILIMEVESGEIHAMVNLQRTRQGDYDTKRNIAINQFFEPGSLMKTFDVMALLEDHKSTTSTIYPSTGGEITFSGFTIRDAKKDGFGTLSLGDALAFSSNTIFAKAISEAYQDQPTKYVSRLNNCFRLDQLNLPFKLTSQPTIPQVNSSNWSMISLPWLSIGYELRLSPIQLLTYYNALANNGIYVQPKFLKKIRNKDNGKQKSYENDHFTHRICSTQSSAYIKHYLRKSISRGNGSVFNSDIVEIAGKTTSTRTNTGNPSPKYVSGFVGYYPHSKPKYSIITILGNIPFPNSKAAGIITKKMAEKNFLKHV